MNRARVAVAILGGLTALFLTCATCGYLTAG